MSGEKVSVIMPAYNAGKYIAHALGSLTREKADLDIIVVDDGSTDNTAGIVEGRQAIHPCIRLFKCDNGGVSRARNIGLGKVGPETRYITFLDADDHSYPGRIARQLAVLKNHPEAQFAAGLVQLFRTIDEPTSLPVEGSPTLTITGVQLGAILFRADIFARFGGFDEAMHYGEDLDFLFRLLEAGTRYIAEQDVAVLYRRHASNATNDFLKTSRGRMDAIHKSLVRRRATGGKLDIGDIFSKRGAAEQAFRNE